MNLPPRKQNFDSTFIFTLGRYTFFLEGKKLLNARVTRKDLVRSKKGKCKIKECDQEILTQNISVFWECSLKNAVY